MELVHQLWDFSGEPGIQSLDVIGAHLDCVSGAENADAAIARKQDGTDAVVFVNLMPPPSVALRGGIG